LDINRYAVELFNILQHKAVDKHLNILNLYKKFFTSIKQLNKPNRNDLNIDLDNFLDLSANLKKETLNLYQQIIDEYPDEKVIIILIFYTN